MSEAAVKKLDPDRLNTCLCLAKARTADWPLIAAECGFDAIYVDLELSTMSLETAAMLCAVGSGAGLLTFIRLGGLDPHAIAKALAGGADGVIVSHIRSAAEARSVVDAVSAATPQYGALATDAAAPAHVAAVMIETIEALSDIDGIAATDGLDLLIIGPWDLTAALGIPRQFAHERFDSAVSAVAEAARAHGKTWGFFGISDPAQIADFVKRGARFASLGTDYGLFAEAARTRLAGVSGLPTL